MGAKDSIKKSKRKLAKRTREEDTGTEISHAAQIAGTKEKKKNHKKKLSGEVEVEAEVVETGNLEDKALETRGVKKKKSQKLRDKKGNKSRIARIDTEGLNADEQNEKKNTSEQCNDSEPGEQFSNSEGINKGDTERNSKKGKLKKAEKIKKKKRLVANQSSSDNLLEKREENAEDEVYQMSSGDEDYSKGMKKWVTQYHQSRPGLKVLQERIDDFIMAHDAKEEQAKAEKLAQAAEDGWTVVRHHKGRKKTTDADSGIAVGAVAQAAVLDKMAKKKKKEVGLAFYQFHKREAHRNEIMMLQSKFEQDKKRIQEMRAARKFRPY